MTNKKKKSSIKPKKKSIKKNCTNSVKREKVTGDPMPVKSVRPVCEYYNTTTGEIYPKVFFKESWWTKFKRFIGLVP